MELDGQCGNDIYVVPSLRHSKLWNQHSNILSRLAMHITNNIHDVPAVVDIIVCGGKSLAMNPKSYQLIHSRWNGRLHSSWQTSSSRSSPFRPSDWGRREQRECPASTTPSITASASAAGQSNSHILAGQQVRKLGWSLAGCADWRHTWRRQFNQPHVVLQGPGI